MNTESLIELIKRILEEKGPCTIEELLDILLNNGIKLALDELFNLINSYPQVFKWTIEVSKNGIIIIPQKVTLTGGVVKLPPNQNPNQ
ncbi:hypothetical protein [uncultured Methanobrevibacter sp.]|uniref:hypothetical protein n=1 Tax=uncultured Methanobrevibacter sp. TaxID=253161 RepID=UPI00262E5C58|nr:hypothetical protein [uncultured Methanobrevibacter sp.]